MKRQEKKMILNHIFQDAKLKRKGEKTGDMEYFRSLERVYY